MTFANFAQFQAPAAPAPHPAQIQFPDLPTTPPKPGTQPGPFAEEVLYLTPQMVIPSEGDLIELSGQEYPTLVH